MGFIKYQTSLTDTGSPRKMKELTLKNKMKIAIETAQAIRYMQEEYPRGPVAHCNIAPCNIYIDENCTPQVTNQITIFKLIITICQCT